MHLQSPSSLTSLHEAEPRSISRMSKHLLEIPVSIPRVLRVQIIGKSQALKLQTLHGKA